MKLFIKLIIALFCITAVTNGKDLNGDAAIASLGSKISEVAKSYKMDNKALIDLFKSQPSLKVNADGILIFSCEAQLPKTDALAIVLPQAVDDVFALHSFPGATRVIYLDFNGHVTEGMHWNSSYSGGAPIVSQPFDTDGDTSTYSDNEKSIMLEIWRRVAEDYAPFNVDVTTQDPGVESLRKTTTSDQAYGIRVVISPTNWYKATAGGVASLSTFSSNLDTPCFVFTGQLAGYAKYIAEAVSHEVGHTVGLMHDGVTGVTEYFEGHGDWAPIMGVGYYKNVVQFSKGEYNNPNNTQDDLAVIAGFIPLATDDHGNSTSNATVLFGPTVESGGTIETRSDVDMFMLNLGTGNLNLTVSTAFPSANLNAKIELLDSSGNVINIGNYISLGLTEGIYYLKIDGVSNGDPLWNGYSDYGSLGNYVIIGTLVPGTGTPPPPPPPPVVTDKYIDVYAFTTVKVVAKQGILANGTVTVLDKDGLAVSGASVSVSWTGIVNGSTTVLTDAFGKATFKTSHTKKTGTVIISVSNVSKAGTIYDSAIYPAATTATVLLSR